MLFNMFSRKLRLTVHYGSDTEHWKESAVVSAILGENPATRLMSCCVFSPADSSVRSSQTCWPRTGLPSAIQGLPPSWSLASRAASPTSPSSHTALVRPPFAPHSPPSRTTSPRLSKDLTRCFSTTLPTTGTGTPATRPATKRRSSGNEAGKEGEGGGQ